MQFRSPQLLLSDQTKQDLLINTVIAQQIFRKSLNTSYIGQMSGKNETLPPTESEQLFVVPEEPQQPKNKRIDFSRFKGEARQVREAQVSEQEMQQMFLLSFSKGEKELCVENGCSQPCDRRQDSQRLHLELLNESTLQLYCLGEEGRFDQLFASLNFDTVSASLDYDPIPANRQISITMGAYRLLLEHNKRKVVEHWYEQLERMITQSKGKEFKLTKIIDNQKYAKEERFQTEEFFSKNCETGDVILFQDDHFFAKAQRFFTRSDFDHVGMVVKTQNYGLLIFQSNSGSGVGLTPWRSVIRFGWYQFIPKISWRRLKVERTKQFNQTVQKFVMENLSKSYHISFAKITAHQSVIRKNTSNVKNGKTDEPDETGFFCSELVATIYKELGLLTRDTSSPNYMPACKFYPKDFSERSGRKLDRGELSPEYTIYFDTALLKVSYRGIIKDK